MVVPINYDDVTADNGFFITKLNDKSGCINGNGKVILPAKYTQVNVDHGSIEFSINDKYSIIDENGVVIKSVYDYIDKVPNSNLSIVKLNNKYGIVDRTGKVMVPFKYDDINYVDFRGRFYANNQTNTYTSIDRFSVSIGEKYGVIDENGTIIVPCKYDDAQILNSGMIILEKSNKFSFADRNGRIISKCKYDDITRVGDFLAFEKNNKYGFLNDNGEEVIPPTYDYISLYYNDIYNSNNCFIATNYDDSDSIVVTKLGSNDDISSLILENEITPKIKLLHNYIQNWKMKLSFSEDEPTTNEGRMNDVIKTFRLYKLDGSNTPILYAYVNPIQSQNFPASYSEFSSLNNDKVKTLISGSECGGSAGGDYVCLYKDNETSKIIIATSEHTGGFGGNAYWREFYKIINGKASTITSYEQVSQDAGNYDKSILLKNAKLFYNDKNLPYTKSTIKDAKYVTEYDVKDKQTTFGKFKKVLGRFRIIPMDMSL